MFCIRLNNLVPRKKYNKNPKKDRGILKREEKDEFKTTEQFCPEHRSSESFSLEIVK
jgi:hypothetical protein